MSLIVTQNISFTLSTRVVENKAYVKYKLTVIIIQKNKIKWIAMILEKIKKKNHQIWSWYEWEIPDTRFNPGLKRERQTILGCSSEPSNFPMCTAISLWVFSQSTKKIWISLCGRLFLCEFFHNRQVK